MMTDFPVKFKGGNAGQVDTGRLRTSNLEVAGSIPTKSTLPGDRTGHLEVRSPKPARTALPPYISTGKSVIIITGFYGNH